MKEKNCMRKILTTLIVAAFVFSAVPALAQKSPKAPKSICFEMTHSPNYNFTLAISRGGKTKTLDGTRTFYDIHGECKVAGYRFPVHGSGYVNGDDFIFTLSGTFNQMGNAVIVSVNARLDLINDTGTGAYSTLGGDFDTTGNFFFNPTDCKVFTNL